MIFSILQEPLRWACYVIFEELIPASLIKMSMLTYVTALGKGPNWLKPSTFNFITYLKDLILCFQMHFKA